MHGKHHTAHCHHSALGKPRILLRLLLLITTFLWLTILRTYLSSSSLLFSGVAVVNLVDDGPSLFFTSSSTFTPDEFQSGNIDKYINLPLTPPNPQRDKEVDQLTAAHVPRPMERLLHVASPTPRGNNVILGLASYPTFMIGWTRLVGSLRNSGYDGHIILGVHPNIPQLERDYLDTMGVTYYAIDVVNCTTTTSSSASSSTTDGEETKNTVRAKCSHGLEDLKLEWGRYEMARRWLYHCSTCTGWVMVLDTRDVFFQSNPFSTLPIILGDNNNTTTTNKHYDLLFVEEIASYTNTILPEQTHRATNIGQSYRYIYHTEPCYGKKLVQANKLINRPMLCSGTVLGTRSGMHRFLSVLVNEFYTNNKKQNPKCHSPTTTDQWTMNYLYYNGQFGYIHTTKTIPWGTGPVLTIGTPCVNSALLSKKKTSQKDMILFHPKSGLILNPHEKEDSVAYIAPTLHQYDRCHDWIVPWFQEHKSLFL